jgi:outer membrane protein OmpA-like peptidoglycan-associated protein
MRTLRTTTAILAGSLAAQGPVFAQSAPGLIEQMARDAGLEMCGDASGVPCMTEDGALRIDQPDMAAGLEACGADVALPCVTAEGYVEVDAASEVAMPFLNGPETVPAEQDAPEEATAETEPEEPAALETVETAPEAPAAEAAEAATIEEAPAPAMTKAEAKAAAKAEKKAAKAAAKDQDVIVVEEAPAAAAAASEGQASADTVMETETVTEETSRSATEEFATTVTGDAKAKSGRKGDGGLSNFEKALIVGLGAVVVGSVLKNGDEVVSNSGDRVVLQDDQGNLRVLKDDDALLRQPGSEVQTQTFADGSTRTVVTREDGTRIVTIRGSDGRVVKRSRQFSDGTEVVLFDDTQEVEPVVVSQLPEVQQRTLSIDTSDEDALRAALARSDARDAGRRFSLNQIRQIRAVRDLAPEIELDAITFASGSAAIQASQAEELAALGRTMQRIIDERPGEVFLIEGHTDAVGAASYNLALSDRRAETVALALTEYFGVPPENMITQGYGESELKIDTLSDERANRRATVRRITPLLRMASN